MLIKICVCCKKQTKHLAVEQLVTHNVCSLNCRRSFDLWLALPPVLRGRLSDWHREREKTKGAA
jgi:hypothetical protein